MIKKVVSGKKTRGGAGVNLFRVFDNNHMYEFDPFLSLEIIDSKVHEDYSRDYPLHAHRGIEEIVYVINGTLNHKSHCGKSTTAKNQEAVWLTAGSGVIHEKMFEAVPHLLAIKLNLNMPSKHKMTNPKVNTIKSHDMIAINENGKKIRVVCGDYKGNKTKFNGDFVKMQFFDVDLEPKQSFDFEMIPGDCSLICVISGSLKFERGIVPARSSVLLKGKKLSVKSCNEGAKFIFLSGKPIKEPIAWGENIVMNNDAELNKAYRELDNGIFIKAKIE